MTGVRARGEQNQTTAGAVEMLFHIDLEVCVGIQQTGEEWNARST